LKGFWQGHVELVLAGVKYEARYEAVNEVIHLTVVDKLTVVAKPMPGATYEESALHALEQFATGKLVARG
jgi:hypothetical protein